MHLLKRKSQHTLGHCLCAESALLTSIHMENGVPLSHRISPISPAITFAIVDGCRVVGDRCYIRTNHRENLLLEKHKIIPVLRLNLDVYSPENISFYREVKERGYHGILLSLPHYDRRMYECINVALDNARTVGLFSSILYPYNDFSSTCEFFSLFQKKVDFFYLDIPLERISFRAIENLADVLPKQVKIHTFLGCERTKRSHALQDDFLKVINELLERVSYGCFAGMHIPIDALSWELLTCITSHYHIQKGYQTELPRFDM